MRGETNLQLLLERLSPGLASPEYVFCTAPDAKLPDLVRFDPLGLFREPEGWTLILERDAAAAAGFNASPSLRLITLAVHSSLEAVGLTAAVATALTRHGISANVVAAFHHDHVFVLAADAERALLALRTLSGGNG